MDFKEIALNVINKELQAINNLKNQINDNFIKACQLILQCSGRVIIIGIGKSGHIASKIAATLASTGTPAFFVHPAEAGHGDFGMITKNDIVIAISNSGATEEVTSLIPMIKYLNIPLIAITSNPKSLLATSADIHLNLDIKEEACPYDLAPTSSTTATLVLGDALAICLLKAKNFTPQDFAKSHPNGSLGKRLILKVENIMRKGSDMPYIHKDTNINDAILEITKKGLGITFIFDDNKKLIGAFTDGDLRRLFQNKLYNENLKIIDVSTKNPKTINKETLAIDALNLMRKNKITALAVINDNNELIGVIHMHDILKQGLR